MNFIFWQGVISIHQCAFIRSLSERHSVTLVVEKKISDERKKQGWSVPNMGNARIIENPDEEMVKDLVNQENTHFVFSGFQPFPLAKKALNLIVNKGDHFSLLLEPYDWRGLKGKLRRLKYTFLAIRHNASIHRLFVTGSIASRNYIHCGFSKDKICQWGYFTMQPSFSAEISPSEKFDIVFVGILDDNKNVRMLIDEIKKIPKGVSLTVIGNGPLRDNLNILSKGYDNISFLGTLPNEEVSAYIANSDLLILPSKYDGWGAVVNEALMVGTPVLASEYCGSSILLDGNIRGECFTFQNFHSILTKWILKGKTSKDRRRKIAEWAKTSISGKAVADYFVEAMNESSAIAPWLKTNYF